MHFALLRPSSLGHPFERRQQPIVRVCWVRMRSLSVLPPALAVAIALGCGRDPRVASPTASETEPSSVTAAGATQSTNAPRADVDAAAGTAAVVGTSSPLAVTSNAAPAAPAPIDARLPSLETLALTTKASCPAKTCRLEGSLLEALLGAPESRSPVGIWEEDLGAGAAVSFARRAEMDVLGLALAGTVAVVADEGKGAGIELAPWHAFVAPGAGITLRAQARPARVVLIVVSAGEALAAKGAAAKASAWTARPAPITAIDLADAPDLAFGKGAYHARIAFGVEASPRASLGILRMSPDGVVPPHVHEKEWEHMAILQGEGDFTQGVGEGEHTLRASDGVIFSVPPATRHQWRSTGSRPFLGIQVYTPPGPEQRFKKLAAGP